MCMNKKVAAIIVTYNRKELLAECLAAVCSQEYKPAMVYLIDNASTDGTDDWVATNNYDGKHGDIQFCYVRLPENIGGSGGFYTGLKMAHESDEMFDAFWLMDDDGIADKAQLRQLVSHLDTHDYLSPLVIAKEDPTRCAFYDMTVEEMKLKAVEGLYPNEASPFNGVLFSRKLVDIVGYPIKDMFIWGDEWNYHCRNIKAGFPPVIVVDAIHVHPKDRQVRKKMLRESYVVPDQDWKLYLYVRNTMYNCITFYKFHSVAKSLCKFTIEYTYYMIFVEHSWRRCKILYRAMFHGIRRNLSHMLYS